MIWVVLLILAIIAAYFIYQGLRARHIERCQHDERTTKHVPDSITEQKAQQNADATSFDYHNEYQKDGAQAGLANQPVTAPHDSPSLLYAERNNTAETELSTDHALDTNTATDTMDLTAETATLNSDEVGMPANNSEYERSVQADNVVSVTQDHAPVSRDTVAANAPDVHSNEYQSAGTSNVHSNEYQPASASDVHSNEYQPASASDVHSNEYQSAGEAGSHSTHSNEHTDQYTQNQSSGAPAAGVVAAGLAGVAGVAGAAAINSRNQQSDSNQYVSGTNQNNQGIDLELGDSTQNNDEQHIDNPSDDDNDELLDFGDLTADISEMLKELNLRESDSPRLEINEKEYQQLKTGDPGEVKPEKIENVADKLRDMLQ